jgi:hypothetical protein
MGVKLVSASTGSVEIVPPTTASNFTATLPAGTGTMVVNGVNSSIVSGTVQPSTTGTFIDFTSIPSWVKRITVMFNGVSTNGTSDIILRVGAGSVLTSGYVGCNGVIRNGGVSNNYAFSVGFNIVSEVASADLYSGVSQICLLGSNTWAENGVISNHGGSRTSCSGGSVPVGGTLDRVRITTVIGTDTFDAGSINILYE